MKNSKPAESYNTSRHTEQTEHTAHHEKRKQSFIPGHDPEPPYDTIYYRREENRREQNSRTKQQNRTAEQNSRAVQNSRTGRNSREHSIMQCKTVKQLTEMEHISMQYESSNKLNSIPLHITKSHYMTLYYII